MDVDTFTSGRQFIGLIEAMPSLPVGCVVLDVQMPGLNGLQVQEMLTKSGHRFPVIFITAHDDVGVREQAFAAGALAFVRKPFNDELLVKMLSTALNREVV